MLVLSLCQPRSVRAESSLTYKYSSYAEEGDRIHVSSNYLLAQTELGMDTSLKVMGLTDSIAGATPTGAMAQSRDESVPTAYMSDYRKAANLNALHQFGPVNLDLGYGVSTESDYVSHGWSANTLTDLNNKNTRVLLGYASTDDTIREPLLLWTTEQSKKSWDVIAGFTQAADPDDSLTLNVSYGRVEGYLDDPYKIVSTTMLDIDPGVYHTVPENRPREKTHLSIFFGTNSNFDSIHAALETSYRYYHDSFDIHSHTVSVRWLQDLGEYAVLEPSVRYYIQSAASFYHYDLDTAGIVTSFDAAGETGTGSAPYYSSDYRLSHMHTLEVGLKLTLNPRGRYSFDLGYNRYLMHGLDNVTPQDVYPHGGTFTLGLRLSH